MTKEYKKYHQRTYAEYVYQNGFQTRQYLYDMRYLALLFRDQGSKPKEIKARLAEFCDTRYPDAPARQWIEAIAKAVAYAQKPANVLIECPYVDMYLSEVEYIDSLDVSENAKRVIFAIMVHKKLDKAVYEGRNPGEAYTVFTYPNNQRIRRLPRVAKLTGVRDVARDVLHELYCCGLLDVIESKGMPFKIGFADQIVFEGRLAVRITDYDSIGLYWEWLHGKLNVGLCCTCWQVYTSRAKNRCYCERHQGYQALGETKQLVCQDCGQTFTVPAKNGRSTRCPDCQHAANVKRNKAWQAQHR